MKVFCVYKLEQDPATSWIEKNRSEKLCTLSSRLVLLAPTISTLTAICFPTNFQFPLLHHFNFILLTPHILYLTGNSLSQSLIGPRNILQSSFLPFIPLTYSFIPSPPFPFPCYILSLLSLQWQLGNNWYYF